jgi:murein DD-endopeptidase MepM/ murein hydrolase activator NlpD
VNCQSGAPIKQGEQIGRTGQTGFAGGDHLHYEVRLNSIPVTPIEWWDSKWIKDHIDDKTLTVGEYLGIIKPEAGELDGEDVENASKSPARKKVR